MGDCHALLAMTRLVSARNGVIICYTPHFYEEYKMLTSMTAFARAAGVCGEFDIVWELKSVNHRYLETSFRLPESLRQYEMQLRDKLRSKLGRGKVDCTIQYQRNAEATIGLSINQPLLDELNAMCEQITQGNSQATISASHLLAWPGVMQSASIQLEQYEKAIFALFDEAIDKLIVMRQQEGKGLAVIINEKLLLCQQHVDAAAAHMPTVLANRRQKVVDKLNEIKGDLDAERLEQEMVYYTQKIDVVEEIERLTAHIAEVTKIIKQGGVVGRRLDFLMQELNREANTLGSKADDKASTMVAVELKVLIEQMREQVQNIE